MLQAMQAAVTYAMLSSQNIDWISCDDAAWLVATFEVGAPALCAIRVQFADGGADIQC